MGAPEGVRPPARWGGEEGAFAKPRPVRANGSLPLHPSGAAAWKADTRDAPLAFDPGQTESHDRSP
jgi:hypothetical protein